MEGVGADLDFYALVTHLFHDLVAILHIDAEGLP